MALTRYLLVLRLQLKLISANAHQFIIEFTDGYDTVVGEKGMSVSGGQRQRIAIARAILKNAPIMLMDEATSALDNESERAVNETLQNLKGRMTIIMIAHRTSTIQMSPWTWAKTSTPTLVWRWFPPTPNGC